MATPLKCSHCGRLMQFEVRVGRAGAPSESHDFFSCACGSVTSQVSETEALESQRDFPDRAFVAWATRRDETSRRWVHKVIQEDSRR